MVKNIFILLLAFVTMSPLTLVAQEILLSEDFNDCSLPSGWNMEVTNNQNGLLFGLPQNENSDSLSIDGSCMVMWDDDILGNNMPTFVGTLTSPFFNTKDFQTIKLNADIHFRQYGTSTFSVYILNQSGDRTLVRQWGDGDGTGSQFHDILEFSADLSLYTTEKEIALIFEYDDTDMYAWYAGMDNVEVIGSGEGTLILSELFNDCNAPADWTNTILEGEVGWSFGEVENDNSSASTMNGSCFAYFDDDFLTQDAPSSTAELLTPVFDGSLFATYYLEMDLIFRRYASFENISIYVFDENDYKIVKEFSEDVGGPHFSTYEFISLDLTEYRSPMMQVAFRYDDGNEWGWWVGIDNIKIIGNGEINDLCANSNALEIGKACLKSNNKNAIFSGPESSCSTSQVASLWYTIEAPETGIIEIENIANYNDQLTIYNGSCENLSEISCTNIDEHGFDGEKVWLSVTANESYIIRISGVESYFGKSKGKNCITANYIEQQPTPNAENIMTAAIPININVTCEEADNTLATIENDQIPEDGSLARSDVWYSFNTEEDKNYSIVTESEMAELVVVFNSSMEVVLSNLYGGKTLLTDLEPGDYYLQISGIFSKMEGDICVAIFEVELPNNENDDCVEAMQIGLNESVSFSNENQSFSGVNPSCDIIIENDVWYMIQTGIETSLYLDLTSDFVNTTTVYEGNCASLNEIWCGSGLNACNGFNEIPVQPNTTYYVQIGSSETDNGSSKGSGNFIFSTEEPENTPINLSVTPICNEDGTATIDIFISGSEDYTLQGNTPQDILLDGEEFLVIATDINGCQYSKKGVINCQSGSCNLDVESFVVYPNCYEEEDGSISLEINGGIGPYEYEWNHTGENSAELNALGSGIYSVKITDTRGCFIYEDVVLIAPDDLISNIEIVDITMAGEENGEANSMVSGGIFPYSYLWSNDETTSSVQNLAPGNYSVTITDYHGCENIHSFTINSIDCNFSIAENITQVTCFGGNDGSISLEIDEEITTISWSNGNEGSILENLPAGVITATVLLENGCERIVEYTIEEPEEIMLTVDAEGVSCNGDTDGTAILSASGGNAGFTFTWPDGFVGNERSELAPEIYMILATDLKGCTKEIIVEITEPELLDLASSMAASTSCHDTNDGVICAFVEGGTAPYNIDWLELQTDMSKVMDLEAGTYNLLVTDINGCMLEGQLEVTSPDPITIVIDEMSISSDDDGMISISITGGTGEYQTIWYKNGIQLSTDEDISNLTQGVYFVEVTDENGCFITSSDIILDITAVVDIKRSNMNIFPNPSSGNFVLESKNTIDINEISITKTDGKNITHLFKASPLNSNRIQFSSNNAVPGIYLLKVRNSGLDVSIPFVII